MTSAVGPLYWPTLSAAKMTTDIVRNSLNHYITAPSPVTYHDLFFQGKWNDRHWDKFRQQLFIDKNTHH